MNTRSAHLENNAHILLLAVGEIGEDLITQAMPGQAHTPTRKGSTRRIRWVAAAAALLLFAISLPLLRGFFIRANTPDDGQDGGNHSGLIGDGLHYMSYEGPVMPLFGAEGYDALTVDRAVTLDFSPVARYDYAATVRDAYTLTNTGEAALTLQLYYPFSATLGQADTLLPTLTLDGQALEGALLVGAADTTESLRDARKTAGYLAYTNLLEDGSYFAAISEDAPTLERRKLLYRYGY